MTDILATIQNLIADGAKKDETIRKLEAEIEKYKEIWLNREKSSDDMFLIYKNDFGEDSIDIIGRNIREFGELLYQQGHKLIARQESNLEFCVYLASFDGNSNFNESIKMIENLIEKKRKEEEENVNNNWPMNRIVPELKVNNDKLKEMKYETVRVQQTIDEFKAQTQATLKEMKENVNNPWPLNRIVPELKINNDKLKEMKDETERVQQTIKEFKTQSEGKFNKMKTRLEKTLEKVKFSLINRDVLSNRFYGQRNLDYVRNSPEILEKMCMRLSVKYDEDVEGSEPPFIDIVLMDDKKKELVDYFDLLQKNLDESTEKTEIQITIREWMYWNDSQLYYKPTTSEMEEWEKEMEQKYGVKNTIGTVSYIPFICNGGYRYLFFCIANSKITCWNWSSSKQEALEKVHEDLKNVLYWDTNAKFATDMDVSDELSDYFFHVSTEELMKISNNHKVMQWMTNNFECLKYNIDDDDWLYSMPFIYDMALQYFEESME